MDGDIFVLRDEGSYFSKNLTWRKQFFVLTNVGLFRFEDRQLLSLS